jgi:hypothetical protein
MNKVYHEDLGGNGFIKHAMETVDNLQIKANSDKRKGA